MSILVTITAPSLENNEVHIKTIIEISEIADFSVVRNTHTELSDKLAHTLDEELINGNIYFVRARFEFLPGGLQGWSNTASFKADNSIENQVRINPPIMSATPRLAIRTFNVKTTPLKFFFIDLTIPSRLIGKVESVSWIIEDMSGEVYFKSIDDRENINSLYPDTLLDSNKVYICRAAIRTTTGNMSEFASVMFQTTRIADDNRIIEVGTDEHNRILNISMATSPLYVNSIVTITDATGATNTVTIVGPSLDVSALTTAYTTVISVVNVDSDGREHEVQFAYQEEAMVLSCQGWPYKFPLKFCFQTTPQEEGGFVYKFPFTFGR